PRRRGRAGVDARCLLARGDPTADAGPPRAPRPCLPVHHARPLARVGCRRPHRGRLPGTDRGGWSLGRSQHTPGTPVHTLSGIGDPRPGGRCRSRADPAAGRDAVRTGHPRRLPVPSAVLAVRSAGATGTVSRRRPGAPGRDAWRRVPFRPRRSDRSGRSSTVITAEKAEGLLADLVRIESVTPWLIPDGSGERAASAFVAEGAGGLVVEVATEEIAQGRVNTLLRLRGDAPGPTLCVNAHIDTVGFANWNDRALEPRVDGDMMIGLGAADDKAGCVAALLALRELGEGGASLAGDLLIALVADEEGVWICTES